MHGASYRLVLLLLLLVVIAHLVAARRRGAQLVEAVAADPMSTREHADPFPVLVEQTLWCWAEANRACRTHTRLRMSDVKGIGDDGWGSHAGLVEGGAHAGQCASCMGATRCLCPWAPPSSLRMGKSSSWAAVGRLSSPASSHPKCSISASSFCSCTYATSIGERCFRCSTLSSSAAHPRATSRRPSLQSAKVPRRMASMTSFDVAARAVTITGSAASSCEKRCSWCDGRPTMQGYESSSRASSSARPACAIRACHCRTASDDLRPKRTARTSTSVEGVRACGSSRVGVDCRSCEVAGRGAARTVDERDRQCSRSPGGLQARRAAHSPGPPHPGRAE